jgi:hypothetical protein
MNITDLNSVEKLEQFLMGIQAIAFMGVDDAKGCILSIFIWQWAAPVQWPWAFFVEVHHPREAWALSYLRIFSFALSLR